MADEDTSKKVDESTDDTGGEQQQDQEQSDQTGAEQQDQQEETKPGTSEQEQEETSEQEVADDSKAEVKQDEAEEKPPSRRESLRIQKLLQDLKAKDTKNVAPEGKSIDYRKMINADDKVYEQLENESKRYGDERFDAGLEQAKSLRFHTRLEIDAPRVEAKYPQFDKSSPEFNQPVNDAVAVWYLSMTGYKADTDTVDNPNLRYSDFVDGIMELAEAIAGKKIATKAQNISRQASNTGLRPDGSSAKPLDLTKAPQDMTPDELKAAIGMTMPRR